MRLLDRARVPPLCDICVRRWCQRPGQGCIESYLCIVAGANCPQACYTCEGVLYLLLSYLRIDKATRGDMDTYHSKIVTLLDERKGALLEQWLERQLDAADQWPDLITETELREQSSEFITRLGEAIAADPDITDITGPAWAEMRSLLQSITEMRASQGFSPREMATFIFSFKPILFHFMKEDLGETADLVSLIWQVSEMVDELGLYTTEMYRQSREAIIQRQQEELIELSTPVVKLWEGILAVPLIGTLDSARTQIVMESLLEKIVETGSTVAIIDITGVPVVDTLVAQHLLKTVAAARLMGAQCIVSGIRPQIAQTIVHLGVDLENVVTKANLSGAFVLALESNGYTLQRLDGEDER